MPWSAFGRELTRLASESRVVVEIGTWFGEGSTRCLVNGLRDGLTEGAGPCAGAGPGSSEPGRLWTVEEYIGRWEQATQRYEGHPKRGQMEMILGSALSVLQYLPGGTLPGLPSEIDLLLLDGDKDTPREFDALVGRVRMGGWIALDDVDVTKNERQHRLLRDWGWVLVSEGRDRNGWSVWQRGVESRTQPPPPQSSAPTES